jgi:hypothetical protein
MGGCLKAALCRAAKVASSFFNPKDVAMRKSATAALLVGVCVAATAGTHAPIEMSDAQLGKTIGGFQLVVNVAGISSADKLVVISSDPYGEPNRTKIGSGGCNKLMSGQLPIGAWSC